MPDVRRFIFWLLILLPLSAQAEIMNPNLPQSSLGLGLSTLHVEQPDNNSEQRYRWDLQHYQRLWFGLRMHNRFGLARDTRPRADSIQVHHHFHEFYSGLQWTGTRLFRYALGAGPLLLLEQTTTRVQIDNTTERTYNRWQLGGLVEAELDYAFNDFWELALTTAWQFRPAVEKQDFSFGVSLQFNFGVIRKDDSLKPRTPASASMKTPTPGAPVPVKPVAPVPPVQVIRSPAPAPVKTPPPIQVSPH